MHLQLVLVVGVVRQMRIQALGEGRGERGGGLYQIQALVGVLVVGQPRRSQALVGVPGVGQSRRNQALVGMLVEAHQR